MLTFSVFMIRDKDSKKSDKWRIIVDEGLMKIESFPHFFHGDYCVPQVSGMTVYIASHIIRREYYISVKITLISFI